MRILNGLLSFAAIILVWYYTILNPNVYAAILCTAIAVTAEVRYFGLRLEQKARQHFAEIKGMISK